MTDPAQPAASSRSDVVGGLCWIAFGLAVAVLSWRMDRLGDQDINPYTIPGLVPGLLGLAIVALGSLMTIRGLRRGGLGAPAVAGAPLDARRLLLVLLLCVGFAGGLLGRVPFALAASLFVFASITMLRWRELAGHRLRGAATAAAIGVCSGSAVFVVFERLFLVRLP